MGLYIPNAKIPVSCNKCYEIGLAHRLRDLGGHCPRMDLHYSPDEQAFKGDRRVDCHLLDVPPHGRLIDADEMFDEFVAEGQRSKRYKLGEKWELNGEEIRSVISRLPTVIPANEEG